MYGRSVEVTYNRPQIVFFTNREVFGYFKNLSRDRWYHMKITDEHKLIKLDWIDTNLWDSAFDSTASKEPTVGKFLTKIMISSILHYFVIKFNL